MSKFKKNICAILLVCLFVLLTVGGALAYLTAHDSKTNNVSIATKDAYAIYTQTAEGSNSGTLTFVRSFTEPKVGDTYTYTDETGNPQELKIDAAYTGFEKGSYSSIEGVPWSAGQGADAFTGVTFLEQVKPEGTAYWFGNFSNCESFNGLDKLDTSSVTTMQSMFGCTSGTTNNSLTSLDLSSWNTSNVENMSDMFTNLTALTTIYADDGWSTTNVPTSTVMFSGCSVLVGSKGTACNGTDNIDATYACIDYKNKADNGSDNLPGYLSYKTVYTITFYPNGGTFDEGNSTDPKDVKFYPWENIEGPSVSRTDYALDYWADEYGEFTNFETGIKPTKDTIYTAMWVSAGSSFFLAAANSSSPSSAIHIKEASQIIADANNISRGVESVKTAYTGYMNDDNVHLYTQLSSTTGTNANDWVECRIVGINHDTTTADTTKKAGLTFQAIHSLPNAYQINTPNNSNSGGWAEMPLHTKMQAGGEIYNLFDTGFTSQIIQVKKASGLGSDSTGCCYSDDTLWIPCFMEVASECITYTNWPERAGAERTNSVVKMNQYAFWNGKVSSGSSSSPKLNCSGRTREGVINSSGKYPSGVTGTDTWVERTAHPLTNYSFVLAKQSGDLVSSSNATGYNAIIPCFCLGQQNSASVDNGPFTVTFDANGGEFISGNSPQTITDVKVGSTVTAPELNPREGYTFDGWYVDSDATQTIVDPSKTPTLSNVTYKAKWGNMYEITFKTNATGVTFAENGTDTITKTLAEGATIEFPSAPSINDDVHGNYTSTGWTATDGSVVSGSVTTTKDETYTARWNLPYFMAAANSSDPYGAYVEQFPEQIDAAADDIAIKYDESSVSTSSYYSTYETYMDGTYNRGDGSAASEIHLYSKIGEGDGLSANDWLECRIVGFNHDEATSGGKAGITFQAIHGLPTAYQINSSNTNTGGWEMSYLRDLMNPATVDTDVTTNGDEIYNLFNADFASQIVTVKKASGLGSGGSGVCVTTDKLWIMSYMELVADCYSDWSSLNVAQERTNTIAPANQYSYWQGKVNDNHGSNDVLVPLHYNRYGVITNASSNSTTTCPLYNNGASGAWHWWERSSYPNRNTGFLYNILTSSDPDYYGNAGGYCSVVPCFCLGSDPSYHTITFDANGGVFDDGTESKTVVLKEGSVITAPETEPTRDGYKFAGWYVDGDETQSIVNFADGATVCGTSDAIYRAKWGQKETFAIYSDTDASLTFINDFVPSVGETYSYTNYSGDTLNVVVTDSNCWTGFEDDAPYTMVNNTPWYKYQSSIKTVTFKDTVQPNSTAYWFYNMTSLTNIIQINNLDTSNIASMAYMFNGCSKLITLDVSSFNMTNVTSMQGMFYGCTGLTSLDLSNLSAPIVTDMSYMFNGCSNSELTSLDLSSFSTENVANMRCMFNGCSGLVSLDLNHFNTTNVTNMQGMFSNCPALKTLDLNSFNTTNVTNMQTMFSKCSNLTTIFVSNNWDVSNVSNSKYMFSNCYALVGSKGTAYINVFGSSSDMKDAANADYAVIDKFDGSKRGFLSSTVYTVTFDPNGGTFSDSTTASKEVKYYSWETVSAPTETLTRDGYGFVGWYDAADTTEAIVDFSAEGGVYVTSNVTYKAKWGQLQAYAVYGTNTETSAGTFVLLRSATAPSGTLSYKNALGESINIKVVYVNDEIETASYTSNNRPWDSYDSSVTTIDIVDKIRPVSTAYWFAGMKKPTTITGLDNLDTSNVKDMSGMFRNCSSLPSLDLRHFNTANVTTMLDMFYGCTGLTSLDLSSFNTSNVTSMKEMFYQCYSLTELDLSSFDTSKVTTMKNMFTDCYESTNKTGLTTIYVSTGWTTEKLSMSEEMFMRCTNLVGGAGTKFSENLYYSDRARIDGGTSAPGYFTDIASKPETTAVLATLNTLSAKDANKTDGSASANSNSSDSSSAAATGAINAYSSMTLSDWPVLALCQMVLRSC